MGSCAAPSAKGDDKFITTDYLQQCPFTHCSPLLHHLAESLLQNAASRDGSFFALRSAFQDLRLIAATAGEFRKTAGK
ncbi:hypothetical protein, partial [Klebsiella pneumoniae]|uniref:hypothetical protein n=1 Tax=Klebsiella pneumoniae TaxID=573 RepID=UPI001D0DB115